MSSVSPNLEMCIHFLYSFTIYNDSAFYFTEIIVLISWAGTPTQIKKRIGSITFHAANQPLISLKLVFLLFVWVP